MKTLPLTGSKNRWSSGGSGLISFVRMELMHRLSVPSSLVAVGHHEGRDAYENETLYPEEIALIQQLSPRKRSEWLASRELLYSIAGLPERAKCLYDDFGKPYLEGVDQFISVSHSSLWCAAMISDAPCGVDIQVYSDTVRRIEDRFLTPADVAWVRSTRDPQRLLHLLWGAKECMYKAYGRKKLGFREHIFTSRLDISEGKGHGEIRYEGLHLQYDLFYRMLPEVAWVCCIQRDTAHPGIESGM